MTERHGQETPSAGDDVEQAIRDLQARVAALEHVQSRPGSRARPRPDLTLIEALSGLDEPADDAGLTGTVTYAGVAKFEEDTIAWQMIHPVRDLLALDETVLARQLSALSSPVRLRILRALVDGPLQTHELQARLDEPSAGQLYHHLRELLATGLVAQPRRSVYHVAPRAVVPLLALLACAHDLATGEMPEAESR